MSLRLSCLVVILVCTLSSFSMAQKQTETRLAEKKKMAFAIAIHGGAGSSPANFFDGFE